MTKPDRIRHSGTETEREANKKRNSSGEEMEVHLPWCEPGDQAALRHARPETRGVGDDQKDSVTETDGAQVEEMTKAGGAVEEEVGEGKDLSSFTPGSPISMPYIPDELNDPTAYPATLAAFKDAEVKYEAKLRRRYHLFTLPHDPRKSCLYYLTEHLLPIRDAAKKAVLHAAKSIIILSSYVDGKPLANCCGVCIKWDEESKTGIILTTAHLIRSKHPTINQWEGRDEYNTTANVIVHLLDGTAKGHYLYHQEHYDLAFFEVRVDESVELQHASFSGSMCCGQDVFLLGRDEHMNLSITHGMVEDRNPGSFDRHHYMYLFHQNVFPSHQGNGDCNSDKRTDDYLCHDDGGSIINLDGKVVGLVNKHLSKSFVPSCILDKCMDLWSKFGYIPRLHLGMKFTSIKLLDPIHIEKMWHRYKIEDGLIVQEVSQDSHAEKLGICLGDIIERFNGECISTTVQLENMLLGRCRDHLDQGNHLNEQIDVSIQVFHTEERLRRNINLIVDVSDGGEVVKRRTCPITVIEGTSASGQSSQNLAGNFWEAHLFELRDAADICFPASGEPSFSGTMKEDRSEIPEASFLSCSEMKVTLDARH
uniref:Uncharacterized protein n=1 Tax=Avena sativa TaxID=4498 RepID=A0ACD5V440_AVESA